MEAIIATITAIVALPIFFVIAFFYWIPILFILFSGKVTMAEKIAWILLTFFVSWFAWIFFLLLAPIKPKRSEY
ncbi:hypothetical protein [Sessilibacter corallicola]|uniref:Superinfection immunity protein n=1 Tax=Sessilibacter corallicola TaxID=2904075 RepID=A0ABQ0A460_9GAMM|nr:hypothetical protein [Sessilibacter corallicola]MCE2026943.1 hypothetical protein [Sessilibacter corallicola]